MNSLEQLREACAKKLLAAARIYRAVPVQLNPYAVIRAEECEVWAAAIRAIDLTRFERGDKQEEK